jgi:hypothetical protein
MKADRFVIGCGETGRMYLIHTREPRFIAEIFDDEDESEDGELLIVRATGDILGAFDFWGNGKISDAIPMLEDIGSFLEESDFRGEREADLE